MLHGHHPPEAPQAGVNPAGAGVLIAHGLGTPSDEADPGGACIRAAGQGFHQFHGGADSPAGLGKQIIRRGRAISLVGGSAGEDDPGQRLQDGHA